MMSCNRGDVYDVTSVALYHTSSKHLGQHCHCRYIGVHHLAQLLQTPPRDCSQATSSQAEMVALCDGMITPCTLFACKQPCDSGKEMSLFALVMDALDSAEQILL